MLIATNEKTWMLASACSSFRAFHSLSKNRQRNTHVEVYKYTVKCASEGMVSPRSTLRSCIYYTPWSYPCNVLDRYSIVEVSKTKKQSVSNAFQYVVLCPTAPSSPDDIIAYGQIAIAKVQK